MEEAEAPRYWCHMCSRRVNPIMEIDTIKCPICQSGFVEEMTSSTTPGNDGPLDFELGGTDSDRALSLWAPILLGMMDNLQHRRRIRRMAFEEGRNEDDYENNRQQHDPGMELDRELESIMRRRSSATILQLLQGMRTRILSESGNIDADQRNTDRDNDRDRERVIVINPFHQTVVVQGSYESNNDSLNHAPIGSLGDYFIGSGLDLLLQHLSENDQNRYGTPPAKKEAVEALPTLKIEETLQCSVCLDDCEIGEEVKEMPCKHKFHRRCILPWLELHSSCPICRFQLPGDEMKLDLEGSRNNSSNSNGENNNGNNDAGSLGDERNDRGRQFSVPLPWPFSSLFSSSRSHSSSGNSSVASISGSSSNANPSTSQHDEN